MADSRVWKSEIEIFPDAGGWQTEESDSQKLNFFTERQAADGRIWQKNSIFFLTDVGGWQTVESGSKEFKFL